MRTLLADSYCAVDATEIVVLLFSGSGLETSSRQLQPLQLWWSALKCYPSCANKSVCFSSHNYGSLTVLTRNAAFSPAS